MAEGTSRRRHRRTRPRRNCTRKRRTSTSKVRKPNARGKRDDCRPDALTFNALRRPARSRVPQANPNFRVRGRLWEPRELKRLRVKLERRRASRKEFLFDILEALILS